MLVVNLFAGPGKGKCLGINTPVIMYDGSVKMIQDVEIGDLLMGPNSEYREVTSISTGMDALFKITPIHGDSFVCNSNHILSLQISGTTTTINMPLYEYFKQTAKFKHHAKLWRTGIDFDEQPLKLPAYVAGLWIGDGAIEQPKISHTIDDCEIVPDLIEAATKLNLHLKYSPRKNGNTGDWYFTNGRTGGKPNDFMTIVRKFVVNDEKRIPSEYLINSRVNRLELLAGLIDTDGYMHNNSCIEISTKYIGLASDIAYLARSLGFGVHVATKQVTLNNYSFTGTYYRIGITGNTSEIPIRISRKQCSPRKQKKNVCRTGFTVTSLGIGRYYGIELNGDGLFLLGDFTVTHNSTMAAEVFTLLKKRGINCELIQEYAKSRVWEESFRTLDDQVYVFGKQSHRQWQCDGKVDVIVTDSPLLLSIIYDKSKTELLADLVMHVFDQYDNLNIMLDYSFDGYETVGRMQNKHESDKIHENIRAMLDEELYEYYNLTMPDATKIVEWVLMRLK